MLSLKNTTVDRELAHSIKCYPDRYALSFKGEYWTYADLDKKINDYAKRLIQWGVTKGTHVGILCEAEPNTIFMMLALNRIGAIAIMLNTSLQRRELIAILENTDVEYLMIGDGYKKLDYRNECDSFFNDLPTLIDILYIGLDGDHRQYKNLVALNPSKETDSILCELRSSVRPEDDSFILFTSGTTDLPKAVVGTQYSRANSGLQQGMDQRLTPNDRVVVAMPLFHCFCLSVNILSALFYGACICLPESRHTEDLLRCIEKEQATVFSSVPALFHAMLCREDFESWNLSSLRIGFIGGSMYEPKLFKEIERRFGYTLLSSLGQTEATSGITVASIEDSIEERSTTVGHFMDHIEYCFKGRYKEICVRGYLVMKEYYHNPKATSQVIDKEGWLHTGDCGYLNECGNLVLNGRIKDFIIRGGENISSGELEMVISNDPRILECKVVGIPDPHYGEEVCICIVKNQDASLTAEEIRSMYEKVVADYKIPKYVVFFSHLPKSPTGKVLTSYLKRMSMKQLNI